MRFYRAVYCVGFTIDMDFAFFGSNRLKLATVGSVNYKVLGHVFLRLHNQFWDSSSNATYGWIIAWSHYLLTFSPKVKEVFWV